MQVETFEQVETSVAGIEDSSDPKSFELIESLGLNGQKNLSNMGLKTRTPYRQLNQVEVVVYKTLFPHNQKAQDYDSGMIPLRVLQVLAHAKELEFYTSFHIWSEHGKPKDPILLALPQGKNEWTNEYHILARWGEALESFESLFSKAKKIIGDDLKSKASKKMAECRMILECPDAFAEDVLHSRMGIYL